jgi:hypothetical protein
MAKPMFNVRFNLAEVTRRFKRLREERGRIMNRAGAAVVYKLASWIMRRSLTRHKTARKFGIEPTGTVAAVTWYALTEIYSDLYNGSRLNDGQFPGYNVGE